MATTVITLHIPEPKIRKNRPKPSKAHRDKSKYSRKTKHKPPVEGALFLYGDPLAWRRIFHASKCRIESDILMRQLSDTIRKGASHGFFRQGRAHLYPLRLYPVFRIGGR